jgi:hypothetical protein
MILDKALNMPQPYADQICAGELKLVVKTSYFFTDDRIGIYATADAGGPKDLARSALVGSVRIADCVKVDSDRTAQMIGELTSQEYAHNFPKDLIPFPKPINKFHYIWVFDKPCKFGSPVKLGPESKIGSQWSDIQADDEYREGGKDEEEEDPLVNIDIKAGTRANNL